MANLSEQGLIAIHRVIGQKYPLKLQGIQYPHKIKTVVEKPNLEIFGYQPYNTIFKKAACLMEAIIRGHLFFDGNKRTGLMTTFAYLQSQEYYLAVPIDVVRYTVEIAQHNAKEAEEINKLIGDIAVWLEKHSSRTYVGFALKVIRYTSLPSLFLLFVYLLGFRKYAARKLDQWYQLKFHGDYVDDSIKNTQYLIQNSVRDSVKAIINRRKMKKLPRKK